MDENYVHGTVRGFIWCFMLTYDLIRAKKLIYEHIITTVVTILKTISLSPKTGYKMRGREN